MRRSRWTWRRRSSSSGRDYVLASENRRLRGSELLDEIGAWVGDYPIVSVEDPLGEDDESGWR